MVWYRSPIFLIAVFCIIPNIGGWFGAIFTASSVRSWYYELNKPSWNPPSWVNEFMTYNCNKCLFNLLVSCFKVFGPAWTLLYTAMGYASYRVWTHGGFAGEAKIPLIVFIIQLIVNWIWTPVFFGLHEIGWAFVVIAILWTLIILTIVLFFRVDRIAGILLIPYLAWVTFASLLNYTIWQLNS